MKNFQINKQISLLLLLGSIFACNNPRLSSLKLILEEKLEIPFNGEIYQALPVFYDFNLVGDLVVYDHTTDELQLYNLPEKEIVKKVKIEREGPNGIFSNINTAFLHNNQFYVIGNDAFYFLDRNGNMLKKITFISIIEKLNLDPEKKINSIRGAWDKTTGEIYFNYSRRNDHEDQFQSLPKFFELVRFDPISESGELIRIPTPDGLVKDGQGHYFALTPTLSIANGKVVYMWASFPEVYVYDLKTKNILEITCIPDGFLKIPPFPYSNYTKTSPFYFKNGGTSFSKITYDFRNERIYRGHFNYLNGQLKGGLNLTAISMIGECLELDTPENSGVSIDIYDSDLHIVQKDITDENALRINRYALVKK
ncbi:DUF4221 domain-containing protein [Belliella sp. R4-6]|uniref:DUF4221 domain-containing protein n=1 Tax=Belliella alkalica TaxID=1730871 RepID=A0ABS9VFV9_9BACT|nr:DUF4221 family protein [Belliella alkalica]MCH7415339.1 DUF4221 domain-containing protein [Belliella alkalica]